ncbi:hypothetical protein GEMRC1_012075 [Eukaryota sp. GEM-RC1]
MNHILIATVFFILSSSLVLFIKYISRKPLPIPSVLPKHLGIIMDGNGRWARLRKLPRSQGHKQGGKIIGEIVKRCVELEIPYVTLYAFSKENWSRSTEEVEYLIKSMKHYLCHDRDAILQENVRFKAIGHLNDFGDDIMTLLKDAEDQTKNKTGTTVIMALSYSGRQEIVDSCKSIVSQCLAGEVKLDNISMDMISKNLYFSEAGDVDLLIRTSGEQRLSNFLLWQNSYSEFIFSKVLWPDFGVSRFNECLKVYSRRQRRFGNA